jgi:hypothetical protein
LGLWLLKGFFRPLAQTVALVICWCTLALSSFRARVHHAAPEAGITTLKILQPYMVKREISYVKKQLPEREIGVRVMSCAMNGQRWMLIWCCRNEEVESLALAMKAENFGGLPVPRRSRTNQQPPNVRRVGANATEKNRHRPSCQLTSTGELPLACHSSLVKACG